MSKQTNFINLIKDGAIAAQKKYGVLASITIAQAILESSWGGSSLASKHHNLFGIKVSNDWNGKTVKMRTAEYNSKGQKYYVNANFRKYDNYAASIEDHALFLVNNCRYRNHGFFNAQDYKGQAQALQSAGYATAPNYARQLIGLIRQYNLNKFDSNSSTSSQNINRNNDVSRLQAELNSLINAGLKVDGVVGSRTKESTKKFQKIMGVSVDGIAGPNTWVAINGIRSYPIDGVNYPHYEYATRWIQWRIGSNIDGIFGKDTAAKVKEWQEFCNKKYGTSLSVDGIVGAITWKAMFKY